MTTLRTLLSHGQLRGLASLGRLLDEPNEDPQFAERMQRIHVQLMVALGLRKILGDMGYHLGNELDLVELIEFGVHEEILNRREARVLYDINSLANEAKHCINMRSRL